MIVNVIKVEIEIYILINFLFT